MAGATVAGATAAWLFPGQGAQRRGMGAELFGRYPGQCALAERLLGYSVVEVCQRYDAATLRQTRYLQPVLFVVNGLSYLARREVEPEPAFLAGHSLGEFNALFAAGGIDFETGLRLVQRRSELMSRVTGGAMAAVVGLDLDRVRAVVAGSGLDGVDVASHNAPTQVVLAGPEQAISALAPDLRSAGARYLPLNVSGPFHSRHMRPVAEEFGVALAGVEFQALRIPVISNVTAQPYRAGTEVDLLVRQLYQPVRWWDSMRTLLDRGVRDAVEVGPGTVLTELWRACLAAGDQGQPDCAEPGDPPAEAARQVRRGADPVVEVARQVRRGADPVVEVAPQVRQGADPVAEAAPGVRRAADVAASGLGCAAFRRDYGIRYAYLAGSMFRGISSVEMVVRMGQAGLMGYFGAGGLPLPEVEDALVAIRSALRGRANFGMNLLHAPDEPELERATVELYLRHDVRFVEAAAYTEVTAPLVRFRFAGAHRAPDGTPVAVRRVLGKASRPETASAFMRPPPPALVESLEREGALTAVEAAVARELPVAGEVCVEADSGGHTDGGAALALVPAIAGLRDTTMARAGYPERIRVGASGGLGTPQAVAAAFVLGADFVLTGSINQCSPQAGTSALVKDLLAGLDVQDTAYAPAGDMFELGARVQVVRKGTLFAARANKLYQLYRQYGCLEDIDQRTLQTLEQTYFRRPLEQVWQETRRYYLDSGRAAELAAAGANPKRRMALVFRWYFARTTAAAIEGEAAERVNFQVHCGPAMGAFNRHVAGTDLADWRRRHVEVIADLLMSGAARVLGRSPAGQGADPVGRSAAGPGAAGPDVGPVGVDVAQALLA